jgi:hypothetical protein
MRLGSELSFRASSFTSFMLAPPPYQGHYLIPNNVPQQKLERRGDSCAFGTSELPTWSTLSRGGVLELEACNAGIQGFAMNNSSSWMPMRVKLAKNL